MTFTVVVYDVSQNKNRQILTFLRKHMNWIQNSVFEADLTKAELRKIKEYVSEVIGNGDSVVIYEMGNEKYVNKDVIGEEKGSSSQIL